MIVVPDLDEILDFCAEDPVERIDKAIGMRRVFTYRSIILR